MWAETDRQKKWNGGRKAGETGGNNYPSPWQWRLIYASPIKVSGWPTRAVQVFHCARLSADHWWRRRRMERGGREQNEEMRRILHKPPRRSSGLMNAKSRRGRNRSTNAAQVSHPTGNVITTNDCKSSKETCRKTPSVQVTLCPACSHLWASCPLLALQMFFICHADV